MSRSLLVAFEYTLKKVIVVLSKSMECTIDYQPLAHVLPTAGLRSPITFTLLPQMFTGHETGTCTTLPDKIPGESADAPCDPSSEPPKAFGGCRG